MNSQDLKNILHTTATTLEAVKGNYPKELMDKVLNVLNSSRPDVLKLLMSLLDVKVEGDLKSEIKQLIQVINFLNQFISSPDSQEIIDFCKSMEQKGFTLKIISWFV